MPTLRALQTIVLLVCALGLWSGAARAQGPTPTPDPCNPAFTAAYYAGQGDAAFSIRSFTVANQAYTCALTLDPSLGGAYAKRGFARAAQGDDDGALADYALALALDEAATNVYINRASLYMGQGNFALAMADLTVALALEPANVRALHNRAVLHGAEGSFDLALADLSSALAVAPDDPALHAAQGAIYLALANASYAEFRALAGGSTPLFGGTPTNLYLAFERNLLSGNFGEWLGLLRPGQG